MCREYRALGSSNTSRQRSNTALRMNNWSQACATDVGIYIYVIFVFFFYYDASSALTILIHLHIVHQTTGE